MATAVDEQDRSGRVGEPTRAKGRRNMSLADVFLRLDGRIGRQGYWLSTVTLDMLGLGIGFLIATPFVVAGDPGEVEGYLQLVLFVVLLWPGVCILGKRLHDRDKSAWWCVILLIPLVGAIWLVVECGFLAGGAEGNRFGRATAKTPFG